jgi:hypothetical protein
MVQEYSRRALDPFHWGRAPSSQSIFTAPLSPSQAAGKPVALEPRDVSEETTNTRRQNRLADFAKEIPTASATHACRRENRLNSHYTEG